MNDLRPWVFGLVFGALCAAAASRAHGQTVTVSTVMAEAGGTVLVPVRFQGDGVVAVQVDLQLPDGFRPVAGADGLPACHANPDLPKRGFFAFQPHGCDPAVDCDGIRGEVLSFTDPNAPLPDDWLWGCLVAVPDTMPDGAYPVTSRDALGSTSGESALPMQVVLGRAPGAIVVHGAQCTGDQDADGKVAIPELVRAVGNALQGCPR